MFKRNEPGLSADDVATMLAYAESSFAALAAMNFAISELADRPELARDLARTAHDMAEELAESFGEYKREYDAARAAECEAETA
ncbi:crotonobetainyl-CoA:carnitine CoA-transferase CaiB-like acyl-CoA transferase [Paraburkholderia sp. Clong3]|uniref:hypothetical protein n=1 Tax=Paraburkholderia sp. Clong3 TaxID=2991061 RepID=UPI003D1C3D9F